MKVKLTLSIKAETVEKAKADAASKNMSLSAVLEKYMDNMTVSSSNIKKALPKKSITDRIKALTKPVKLSNLDYKKEWHKHLDEKYGK